MEAILAIRRLLLTELAIHSTGGQMEDLLDQMEGLEVPMEDLGGQTLLMEVQVQVLEEVGGSTLLMEVQALEDPRELVQLEEVQVLEDHRGLVQLEEDQVLEDHRGLVQLVEDQVLEDPLDQMEV